MSHLPELISNNRAVKLIKKNEKQQTNLALKKRILIHDYAGHPFQIQLSRALASRGYTVMHVYFGSNNTPKGDLTHRDSDPANLVIKPVYTKDSLKKYSYFKRFFQEIEYGKGVCRAIRKFQPDVVISANAPLNAQKIILDQTKKIGAKFIYWLQDVLGLASFHILKEKIPYIGKLIGKYYIEVERRLLRVSDKVVLISEDFSFLMENWGINKEAICVIPNWAPLGDIAVFNKENKWSKEFLLEDKFCFLYTGTLGLKHNSDLLLQLATSFQDQKEVRVVVVSEGPGATWLKARIVDLDISNLIVLDYQSFEDIPLVMATGDVLVAVLESSAGLFSVPSKVLTYLCAERPILLAVPLENMASKTITQAKAGLVSQPSDLAGFIKNARFLYENKEIRYNFGRSGREYAEENFDIAKICKKFEGIIT